MVFENGVKNIQAVAYNGARTVLKFEILQITWNKGMVFENGVKSIQAVAYNGAHTVDKITRPENHRVHSLRKNSLQNYFK